jgi:hypothetical protein
MKEEELKSNYDIHINIYRSEHNHDEQQTIKHQSDNGVQQSHLHPPAFSSVGEAFLFMFKSLKLHCNNEKRIEK